LEKPLLAREQQRASRSRQWQWPPKAIAAPAMVGPTLARRFFSNPVIST